MAWEKFQEATVPLSDEDVLSKQEIGKHLKTLMSSIRRDTRPWKQEQLVGLYNNTYI